MNIVSQCIRHGFGTDLNDAYFNKIHKLILGSMHISVNYNRKYCEYELQHDEDDGEDGGIKSDDNDANEWMKECNPRCIKEAFECPYIEFIMEQLDKYSNIDDKYIADINKPTALDVFGLYRDNIDIDGKLKL